MEQIGGYLADGDPKLLGAAEAFSFEYGKIPQLAERLQCFQYMMDFPVKKDDLDPSITCLNDCSVFIKESKNIQKFLQVRSLGEVRKKSFFFLDLSSYSGRCTFFLILCARSSFHLIFLRSLCTLVTF
jgi:hypothetical protein